MTGGGSGHEPYAAGFVGRGMVTAAVAGLVFAAPATENILSAIECVNGKSKASESFFLVRRLTF